MRIYTLIITMLIFTFSCTSNNVRRNSDFKIIKENEHSPWKTVIFFNLYKIKCPKEWKISRDRSRVFMRPDENRPIGIVIGVEEKEELNKLPISKYFINFYKRNAMIAKIAVGNIKNTILSGVKAIKFDYAYKNDVYDKIIGYQILIKHKGVYYYITTECPINLYDRYSLSLNWIVNTFEFIN